MSIGGEIMEEHYEKNVLPKYRAVIEAQEKYLEFLGRIVGDLSAFAANHHAPPSIDDIMEGEKLRATIDQAKLNLLY